MASIFDRIWQEKIEHDKNNPIEFVKVRPDLNPNFNVSILKQNIHDMDSMSDSELRILIDRSYKSILKNVFSGSEAAKYISYFRNIRFLNAFADVTSKKRFIDPEDLTIVNELCYHYIVLSEADRDPIIFNKIMGLVITVNTINNNNYYKLAGLGLSEDLIPLLLASRYSNMDLNVCVKRVNFIIITQPSELMSEDMIEKIFRILYDNIAVYIYNIFPSIMMDVLPEYQESNPNTYWVEEGDIQTVDSTLSLAVLKILNTLDRKTLRDTLINYSECINIVHAGKVRIRFSLTNLSNDYFRIVEQVELLREEGIYVP